MDNNMTIKEFFLLKLVLPLAETVKGTCAMKWFHQIDSMNRWTPSDIQKWQEEHLQDFIKHAYEHTVYYRQLFDNLSISPDDIKTIQDLKKLPVITKDIIREHFNDLVADDLSSFRYRRCATGGTTGSPMPYLCDENVWGYVTAAKIYYWRKAGYRYGDKFAALGSASILNRKPPVARRIYDIIRREIAMNSMGLDDNLCRKYLDKMKKSGIHILYGYASSIFILAKYAKDNHYELPLTAVFTTSENLTEHYRMTIEEAFGCKVMDCYGARDAGITAYEDTPGHYYIGYNALTEIEGGTILSTNILNYCFPLIRYDFGDVGEFADDGNYNGQVLSSISGRKSDVIRLDNGRIITSPGFTVLMTKFDICEFQIKQTSNKSICLTLHAKNGKLSEEDETKLMAEMHRYVGDNCDVDLLYVDSFDTLANGKRDFFICS